MFPQAFGATRHYAGSVADYVTPKCSYNMPRFEWDESKRSANVRKHGIDFENLAELFDGLTLTYLDHRFQYDETRYITIGRLGQAVVLVAHTENHEVIRIIHARKASKKTARRYFRLLHDRTESTNAGKGRTP